MKRTRTTMTIDHMAAKEFARLGDLCIWQGCTAHFDGVMPPGWRYLIHYSAPRPDIQKWTKEDWINKKYYEAVICPEHYQMMMRQFKTTG